MYSFGLVAIAFSAMRIYAINRPSPTFLDYLEYQFQFMLWSVIEAFAPALCVSVPAIFGGIFKWKLARQSSRFSSKNKRQYLGGDDISRPFNGTDISFNMSIRRPYLRQESAASSYADYDDGSKLYEKESNQDPF